MWNPKYKLLLFLLLVSFVAQAQKVKVIDLESPIYPATADFIQNGLEKAKTEEASCVILKINTPGGLLDPTRKIVGAIMQSSTPVVSFVAPSGAHAGSAGAFIALSADFVAMAPETNIGAAHPVSSNKNLDSVMHEKMTNDAVAFIRSIAEKRGRNADLLQEMVTNSRSFSAQQALKDRTIDTMAQNVPDLLTKLDGNEIELASGQTHTLHTKSAEAEILKMGAREEFLNILNNPNVMYLLLLAGMLGILFEIFNPGALFPGIIGILGLILGAYGMTLLPVNYTGLALLVLGMVLFLLELKFASYGLLTVGGAISLFLGATFLVPSKPSFDILTISWSVIISSVGITVLFFVFIIGLGLKAQFQKVKTGRDTMIGKQGIALEKLDPAGHVRVNGEIWKAITREETIPADTPIEVIGINHLKLVVKSLSLA